MSSDDDDVSSMASSSFFSQLSGTGPSSGRKRKTVQWRDSWDQEAVKTSSKSYMAMLIKEGPVVTLQNQICTPRSSLTCASSPCELLPPRFWTDWSSLILDASISNLMTLDLLPGDVLGSVQCSTTTFCIEKGSFAERVFIGWRFTHAASLETFLHVTVAELWKLAYVMIINTVFYL